MADARRVLVTVSGPIPDDLDRDVAAGRRPRADYRVLAEVLDADIVDLTSALERAGRIGRVLHRIAGAGAVLGWAAFRQRKSYDLILTDGEHVGLPLALLTRVFGRGHAQHAMIVHVLSAPKKVVLIRWLRLAGLVDRYLVYCTPQLEFIIRELGVPVDRVVLTTFMVDTKFFDPALEDVPRRRMICSAGLERRDYQTLMEAVDGLDVEVVIAAASPWSRQADRSEDRSVPSNVTIERLSLFDLRQRYAACQLVVMPLVEVDFQAGITTILEAMSMAVPVICTRTAGQTDTIADGITGVYVSPSDPAALRAAIVALLDDSTTTTRMGEAARRWVVENADVERYASAVARALDPERSTAF